MYRGTIQGDSERDAGSSEDLLFYKEVFLGRVQCLKVVYLGVVSGEEPSICGHK